jgi:phospholipid transport system transporter-binding protein
MRDAGTNSLAIESLTATNATAVLAQGLAAIEAGQTEIDLAGLQTVDSAAVAVLLAWQRAAQARNASLKYRNLPANLCSLATLYGVEGFLVPA